MTGEPISDAAREAVEQLLHSAKISGSLSSVRGDFDEDGFHLCLELEQGDDVIDVRVADTSAARDLLREVSRLRTWIEDEARERSAYDAASQEERDEVLGRRPGDPDPGERMRESVDLMRKRERES